MKTIILLLLALTIKSQTTIFYVTPVTLCPGDSIGVLFKYNGTPGESQFNFQGDSALLQIWQYSNTDFNGLPKSIVGGDTLYFVQLPTYSYWKQQKGKLSVDWVTTWDITLRCAAPVGLPEYSMDQQAVTYYDLMGNAINKRLNELLIEQRGGLRRKVYIIN